MFFSAKITYSILSFLEHRGLDLEELYDSTDLSFEFMKDPSTWLEASKVEAFLEAVDLRFLDRVDSEDLLVAAGHESFRLKSWGALDSVLKMMQKPEDIYMQPQRFLSYFVSPEVTIKDLNTENNGLSFILGQSLNSYPLVISYLRAALESLPQFIGQNPSCVKWEGDFISISWSDSQQELMGKCEEEIFVHPQLLNSIVKTLEDTQNELERRNEELLLKTQQCENLKNKMEQLIRDQAIKKVFPKNREGEVTLVSQDVAPLVGEVAKLNDYLLRSRQLVTLLVSQGKLDKQAQVAMKKVGWDHMLYDSEQSFKRIDDVLSKIFYEH